MLPISTYLFIIVTSKTLRVIYLKQTIDNLIIFNFYLRVFCQAEKPFDHLVFFHLINPFAIAF